MLGIVPIVSFIVPFGKMEWKIVDGFPLLNPKAVVVWIRAFGGEIFAEIASDYVFRYNPTDES